MTREQLIKQIREKRTFLCVGLDTDTRKLPACLVEEKDPIFAFNRAIIDATAPYCVAYKPNLAFYEAAGLEGWKALESTVEYLHRNYPNHLVIADAKRGDIGNTSGLYARTFFEELGVDALTVAPYMGHDSVSPFLSYTGHWVVVLALTSNPGSADFQLLQDKDGTPLYEHVLRTAMTWGNEENTMFVVGATRGRMFEDVRRIAPRHFLLVPGVGAQGGSLQEVCRYGMNADCGLLVNSSRSIIYADSSEHFAEAAREAAHALQSEMAKELGQMS